MKLLILFITSQSNKNYMSTLIEKINSDFTTAYKAKEMEKKDFLGVLKGEVTRETKVPTDQQVIAKVKSMIKKNNESIETFKVSSLTDVELEILNSYVPKQMSESEIDAKVSEAISGGADNIGKIMGSFKGLEADMKLVKERAEKQLNSK